MATETKDFTGKWFDAMSEGFKTAMDAGRSAQDTMFKTAGGCFPEGDQEGPMGEMRERGERFARAWQPMMKRNMDTAIGFFDKTCKSGMDAAKTSFDAMSDMNRDNFEDRTRKMWDASFAAMRTSFDAMGTATKATMDNFTGFWTAAGTCPDKTKAAPKSSK